MMDLGAGSSRATELSSGRLGMESWAESPFQYFSFRKEGER